MATLNLSKGEDLNLSKGGLANIIVFGLGWSPAVAAASVDLDASVSLFAGNSRTDTVYYGNLKAAGVVHSGDDLTGDDSDGGPDEVITVTLDQLPPNVDRLEFIVNLYDAEKKRQTVAQAKDAFVEIGGDIDPAKFVLSDSEMTGYSVLFGTAIKKADGWHFITVGQSLGKVDLNGAIAAVARPKVAA